jgi:DNA-directed RNA polymerase subunit alpha
MYKYLITYATKARLVCLERKTESARLHYGRFALCPLFSGRASMLGTSIRKALLAELPGLGITSALFGNVIHEFATISGVRESVYDIVLNLKDIVLMGDIAESQKASILCQGPGIVTAENIKLPAGIQVVDNTQYIACLEKSAQLQVDIVVQKGKGWQLQASPDTTSLPFTIDTKFGPVRHVSYNVYCLGEGPMYQELLMIEVWTNGAITPEQALHQASQNLALLFQSYFALD